MPQSPQNVFPVSNESYYNVLDPINTKHAEICPVCSGWGRIYRKTDSSTTAPIVNTCHGCQGRGWVVVE